MPTVSWVLKLLQIFLQILCLSIVLKQINPRIIRRLSLWRLNRSNQLRITPSMRFTTIRLFNLLFKICVLLNIPSFTGVGLLKKSGSCGVIWFIPWQVRFTRRSTVHPRTTRKDWSLQIWTRCYPFCSASWLHITGSFWCITILTERKSTLIPFRRRVWKISAVFSILFSNMLRIHSNVWTGWCWNFYLNGRCVFLEPTWILCLL